MISTVFHQAPDEFDRREFIPPDAYGPLTSEAYRNGEDPALAATLAWKAGPAVADSVAALVATGDSAAAERLLRSVQQQPVNRYRSLEAEINALGYQLLGGGAAAQAVTVFRINTRSTRTRPTPSTVSARRSSRRGSATRASLLTARRCGSTPPSPPRNRRCSDSGSSRSKNLVLPPSSG